MFFNNKIIKIILILLLTVGACSVLLFQAILTSFQQIDKIKDYQQQITNINEIHDAFNTMADNMQNYILLKKPEYLNDYYKYSALLSKKQAEFLTNGNLSNNKNVFEFIDLYKSYINFVSVDVIPAIQNNQYTQEKIYEYYLRNHKFCEQINAQLYDVRKIYNKNLEHSFQVVLDNVNKKTILLLIVWLISMFVLPYVFYLFLKPYINKCFYANELAEHTDSALIFADNSGKVKYINKSARDLFGLLPEMVNNKHIEQFSALFPSLQNITQPLLHVLLTQKPILRKKISFNNDGRSIDLTVDYLPIILFNKLMGILLIARLTDEQKDKPLLLDTLEKERKRISIEIHDWIARYMSTIIHSLDYNLRLHKAGQLNDNELMQNLSDLRNHCQNAAIEMRGIMNDIHPYLIDKVGLISALESYIQTYEKLNKIKVYIFYQDRALRVKKKDEIIIYRIIQEALSNIVKHAKATEADINFTKQQETLKIEIMDNGGSEGDFLAGKGLWGMKERAALIGGDITFGYGEGGFCVTLTVPIQSGGQADEEN
ncbi:ATP-binding protein [Desulforamulus hydrothermalis]|uniref:histidine kinase n=1 Tax=Desulforamulus hydrothermalis Lam5 = DSM 18033 TaxID=1121428 RepID=K8DX13_9FIRM|nr:ATP-binding protein [Desulforamulus hydrothermalis]CCO07072.1 putative PAS/PAC sensor protein [Desulforamulus hydrothermalis Lam5 = DSM 18033]SHH40666.1 PAS domain S-box-containing protein [Desulforamulus hydrothermalis Lam5 = DSM 18033]